MIYAFGEFELDDERFELRRGGAIVPAQPKVLDLLFLLVRNRNRVVRKQEILEALWPAVSVGEASLAKTVMGVRRALRDDTDPPEMVLTVRGRGFRFAKDVDIKHSQNAEPASAPEPQRTAIVGRDAVTASLVESFEAARSGKGGSVWVVGPHGIGRSSVLAELVAIAKQRGARAVLVRCVREAPPGWVWIEMARLLDLGLRADLFEKKGERFASFEEALRVLRKAVRTSPIVIAFDDVEEMDDASAALLQFLGGRVDSFLFVSALADGAVRSEIVRELSATQPRVVLRPLSQADVAVIAEQRTGKPIPEALLGKLVEKSGGNPGLLGVLLGTWWATAALEGGEAGSSIDLEEGVIAKLGRTLEGASEPCKTALATAALFGESFELAPLVRALDQPMSDVLDLLDEGARAQLIRKPAGGVGAYRFAQPMVRDVLVKGLTASARAERHAAVAESLAEHGADPERIADHMVRAAPVGRVADAIEWALRAAELCASRGAAEDTAAWIQRAEAAARLEPSDERSRTIRERTERLR